VIDLVRLALACESAKKALCREDIPHHIPSLAKKGLVQEAITLANTHLEQSFGMRLVPAPSGTNLPAASNSVRRRQALAHSSRANDAQATPTSYLLISTLSTEEKSRIPARTVSEERLALLKVVLVIIALSGGFIEHLDLRNALLDVNLFAHNHTDPELGSFDAAMAKFIRKKYIERRRNASDASLIYGWGPRATAEFPKQALVDIITAMAESIQHDQPRLSEHVKSSLSRLDRQ